VVYPIAVVGLISLFSQSSCLGGVAKSVAYCPILVLKVFLRRRWLCFLFQGVGTKVAEPSMTRRTASTESREPAPTVPTPNLNLASSSVGTVQGLLTSMRFIRSNSELSVNSETGRQSTASGPQQGKQTRSNSPLNRARKESPAAEAAFYKRGLQLFSHRPGSGDTHRLKSMDSFQSSSAAQTHRVRVALARNGAYPTPPATAYFPSFSPSLASGKKGTPAWK
jgi:hypothetical protein